MIRTLALIAGVLVFGFLIDLDNGPSISQPREKSTVHIRVYHAPIVYFKEPE